MRRALGVILVLLGSLFIGIGLLAKPYLYHQLAIAPLDQRSTSVSRGTDMDVLYAHVEDGKPAIDKLSGVTVISTRQVIGIPGDAAKAEKEDTDAFWQTTVKSQADLDGSLVDLSYSDAGVSIDRRTAEATNCCGDYVSTGDLTDPTSQEPMTFQGLYFKFPFDVQQQDYLWWDSEVQRAEPMRFQKVDDIDGLRVYVFQQKIGPEALTAVDAPASLFQDGASGNVSATEMYSNTRTLWVEPVTGVLIDGREDINNVYEAEGYDTVAKTVGTIGFDDQTVAKNAKDWGSKARLLSFIDNWLLLVGLGTGVVLIGLGGFLLLSPQRSGPSAPRSREMQGSIA